MSNGFLLLVPLLNELMIMSNRIGEIPDILMKVRFLLLPVVLTVLSCSSELVRYYPGNYYPEDSIYQNKKLKFLITYDNNWQLWTDPVSMDPDSRKFARQLHKSGIELLFIGTTAEKYLGTRAIAVNLNEPAKEYAEYIRRLNLKDIQNDQGLVEFTNGRVDMIKWTYEKSGYGFAEFFFNSGTFDIRIAFWTRKAFFKNFLPVFESIMGSLVLAEAS